MNPQAPKHYRLSNVDTVDFLQHYWQKKPCILRQAFKDFIDPLDEHELAGLAQDPDIDSRIVSFDNKAWDVSHGPIDDFEEACIGAWSLLVQSVDHQLPNASRLMSAFDFIPHWRMDDLMVSFSNHGAGVGAHIDQYDVFIIQGKGSRRWQVGPQGDYSEHFPHEDLRQIEHFEPLIDEVLQPGDVIYIPPGFPHNGVALEDCLNYSVGFRAPSQQELLSSLADFAIDEGLFNQRYKDQNLSSRGFSGEIKQQEVAVFKALFQEVLDSQEFPNWLGHYLSNSQGQDAFAQTEIETYNEQEVINMLNSGACLVRKLGLKPVFIEETRQQGEDFRFYLDGQSFTVPNDAQTLIKDFLAAPEWSTPVDTAQHRQALFITAITELLNQGYWSPA